MSYKRSEDLPSYSAPPVNEVAIGIGFSPLTCWNSVCPGEFRALVRDKFPKIEDKGPLPPLALLTRAPESTATVLEIPPVRRTWYLADSTDLLIQVQEDRLHVNWRRVQEEDSYPRYGRVLGEFTDALDLFQRFVEGRGERIFCTAGEVSYVNHIPEGPLWSDWNDLSSVLQGWSPVPGAVSGIEAIAGTFTASADSGSNLVADGRQMTIDIKTAIRRNDQSRIVILQLVNRGRLGSSEHEAVTEWCGRASEEIVRAFTQLTTARAHEHWRRIR
jgi:uncharacterized protein (TIGR04255 family)